MARNKFRGPELIREIDEALDKGLARFLILTQGKLSKNAPIKTGRFASSWLISKGSPIAGKAAERSPGTSRVAIEKYSGKIALDSNWWIQNNLDYAERVCFVPKWSKGGRGGSGWFTKIANNLDKDAERAFDFFLRKVK
tara:strand:- start:6982 stop:7398 length:417 start_codon:yes stop_codon:yes gene_type:complete